MELIILLGLVAVIFTNASFLPQAIKTIKTKHTKDLSLGMYLMLATGLFLWLLYGILIKDFPLILSNGISLTFTLTILFLIIRYK
ncbi:SemiSWEET transporter [Patescibacteria group bacterium]|nr:SemiSWEET transporter [Patescibacteria group bacterium]